MPRGSLWMSGLVCLALVAGAQAQDEPASKLPDDLSKDLAEAVSLLESKEYGKMLNRFVVPEQRQQMINRGEWDGLIAGFDERAPKVLSGLKHAQKTPDVQVGDTSVEFKMPADFEGPGHLTMLKIDGRWYIKN